MHTFSRYEMPIPSAPAAFELHIGSNPKFTARFGRKVKKLGGKYSACRGHSSTRFVTIPNTPDGCALADQILAVQEGTKPRTVITRSGGPSLPAWINVHKVRTTAEALNRRAKMLTKAAARNIVRQDS